MHKNEEKNINSINPVFLINVKVIPNKSKRYENDKRKKFNLETVNKDYLIKLKEQCKNLFIEAFAKKYLVKISENKSRLLRR